MYFIPAVHCRNNSCENGGTCLDAYSTYCYCAAGFTGYSCETSKCIMCLVDVMCNSQYTGLFISDSVLQQVKVTVIVLGHRISFNL